MNETQEVKKGPSSIAPKVWRSTAGKSSTCIDQKCMYTCMHTYMHERTHACIHTDMQYPVRVHRLIAHIDE